MSKCAKSKYVILLRFLPVTLCHRLHDRPYTDWQNPPYEGQADLDIPGVEEDSLANLLGHLPALLLRHQLGIRVVGKGDFEIAGVCLGDAGGDIFALLFRRHTAGFFRHLTKMFSFSK